MAPWLSTHSAPLAGERWCRKAPKGAAFPSPARAVVKVFYKRAPSTNLEVPSTTLSGIAAVKLKNPRGDSPVKL